MRFLVVYWDELSMGSKIKNIVLGNENTKTTGDVAREFSKSFGLDYNPIMNIIPVDYDFEIED